MEIKPDFILIPYPVLIHPKLTPRDKFVYGIVYWFSGMANGVCTATNETIGKIANLSDGGVANSLIELEKFHFIRREFENGDKNIRKSIIPLITFKGGVHGSVKGGSRMREQNTEYTNTELLPASPLSEARGSSQGEGEDLEVVPSDDFTPSRALQRREAKERGYKGAETNPLLAWGEARVGRRFPNPLKQKRFIADMLRVGYSSEAIKEAWLELEDSEWWLKRGFDFADVAGQIGKLKVRRRA